MKQNGLRHGHALYAVLALAIGIAAGVIFSPQVPDVIQPYLPIAVVAALDTVFGGLRAYLDDIFDAQTFVVSFVFNVLVAALIVWLGDQLGVGGARQVARPDRREPLAGLLEPPGFAHRVIGAGDGLRALLPGGGGGLGHARRHVAQLALADRRSRASRCLPTVRHVSLLVQRHDADTSGCPWRRGP